MAKYREIDKLAGRVFAIGDSHGCDAELAVMLNHLTGPLALKADDLVVFIGDYIDRGPSSKGVIDRLISFGKKHLNSVFLRGNHEDILLGYLGLGGSQSYPGLYNGGKEFLKSYGVSDGDSSEKIMEAMPGEHVAFFVNLESYVITPQYIFAHAGLSPIRDLRAQLDQDIFWIRDEFIQNIHHFGKTVVFGHTPYERVLFHLPYKIGIDTGVVFGNKLSVVELTEKRIFSVGKGESVVKEDRFPQ